MKILQYKKNNFAYDYHKFNQKRLNLLSNDHKIEKKVKKILSSVKNNGDKALFDYCKKFDKSKINKNNILISKKMKKNSINQIDPEVFKAFKKAIQNLKNYHKKQIPNNYKITKKGIKIGSIWKPIESVGLYVPGGKATYPSSLIMNVVPALVAGVKRIVVVTPSINNLINPYILSLLDVLKIEEAYQIGGAHSIGALAYGTKTIEPVKKIFGPGNTYVTTAKKQVYGNVGIDLIAGPSEIVVVADKSNNPDWVAADIIAQAEHDENAQSILITNNLNFANKVKKSIQRLIKKLSRKDIIKKSLQNNGIIIMVENMKHSSEIINIIAPEHLHLQNKEKNKILDKVNNAGAIFVGEYSTEAYGDYIVGTNHVLPTCGSAAFSSGLNVLDFMKRSSYIQISKKSSMQLNDYVSKMSSIENLDGHKLSVKIRQISKK